VCNAGHNYDMKAVLGDFNAEVEKNPVCTHHVEDTACTT